MTADELAEMFVPVPMRWRRIVAGDVIVGKDGALLLVRYAGVGSQSGEFGVVLQAGMNDWNGKVDPDDVATVLLPAGLRDAMQLTRDELGAQLLERRGAA